MRNLTEAVNRMKLSKYFEAEKNNEKILILCPLIQSLSGTLDTDTDPTTSKIDFEKKFQDKWYEVENHIKNTIFQQHSEFKSNGEKAAIFGNFGIFFAIKLCPLLIDLTRSFREGNWILHLDEVIFVYW